MTARASWRQADLERALKAAISQGLAVREFSVTPAGEISIQTDAKVPDSKKRDNAFDRELGT